MGTLADGPAGSGAAPSTVGVVVEKLEDVWASRDFPVLVAAARRVDAGESMVMAVDLENDTGLPEEDVQRATKALERRGLLQTIRLNRMVGGDRVDRVKNLSGDAYLLTGLHPDGESLADQLVEALRQAADLADNDEDRRALRASARALGSVSGQTLAGVLTALASKAMGFS